MLKIQFEPDAAFAREMFGQIVEEKFPFGDSPKVIALVVVETNPVGRDQVELFSKRRKRSEWLDRPDHALDLKQSRDVAKHWLLIGVEADAVVAKQLSYINEVTCTAAEIENALRRLRVEAGPSNLRQVDVDPMFELQILRPAFSRRIGFVALPNSRKLIEIDRLNDAIPVQLEPRWDKPASDVFSRAENAFTIKQLSNLAPKSHRRSIPSVVIAQSFS